MDEIHCIKSSKALITKIFNRLQPSFVRRYGFTAMTIMKNLYDLYYTVEFVVPRFFVGWKWFTDRYFVRQDKVIGYDYEKREPKTIKELVRYQNLGELRERLDQVMIRYYPNRKINHIERTVEFSLDTLHEYQEEVKAVLEDKSPASCLPKLQQIVNRDANKQEAFKEIVNGL